jgi:hypothetical protein
MWNMTQKKIKLPDPEYIPLSKPKKREPPRPLSGVPLDEVVKARREVDENLRNSAALSTEEEEELLDDEIERLSKHQELTDVSAGKVSTRREAELSQRTGVWKLIGFVIDFLRKFII